MVINSSESVKASQRRRARRMRKALTIAIAAGTVLGGQAVAFAEPALPDAPASVDTPALPQPDSRQGLGNYKDSEIVQGIGDGMVSIMGGKNFEKTEPFEPQAGSLRQQFGAVGTHEVTSTRTPLACDGVVYTIYNQILREMHGTHGTTDCYDVFPESLTGNPVGVQMVYPTDIASMESAPLIVLSPGIGTEPGFYDRQARLYASHGYVVAIGYNFTNWFGPQMVLAAANAVVESQNEASPLHNKIDFSRTLLVGHSAGGGSAIFLNDSMDKPLQNMGVDMHTRGVVAINPGPSDGGLLSEPTDIPTLVAVAENESIVPEGMDRRGYEEAVGPAWLAVVNGSYHGTYLDLVDKNVLGSMVLSFGEYLLEGTPRATAVYEGPNYSLATDSELSGVERKNI